MKQIAKLQFEKGDIYEYDDFLLEQVGNFLTKNIKNYITSENGRLPDRIEFDADYEIVIRKSIERKE